MRFKPQLIFTFVLLIFFIVFVYQAKDWRLQARLYPWVIGMPMIFLALLHMFNEWSGRAEKAKQSDSTSAPMDFQFTQGVDSTLAFQRTMNIFSWILGFYAGIWLLGFRIMVPLFVFLYLKLQSGERWVLTIVLTGSAWLLFWGLFVWLLQLPFPDGHVFTWLGLD